jgi:hypothetical protein
LVSGGFLFSMPFGRHWCKHQPPLYAQRSFSVKGRYNGMVQEICC